MIEKLVVIVVLVYEVQCRDSIDYTPCNKAAETSSTGEDVVDAALALIEESLTIKTDDFSLMRRIALVESNFGQDQRQSDDTGGIWKISAAIFNALKSENEATAGSRALLLEIKEKMGYDCFLCELNFSTPMLSALAARVFVELKAGNSIPSALEDQASWWSANYHTDGEASTFQQKVEAHEGDTTFDNKMDMFFMLDGSYDVSEEEWESSVNFTCSAASKCSISKNETQVGMSVYNYENDIDYAFENTSNYDDFQTAAYATEKPEPIRNCGGALKSVVDTELTQAAEEDRWNHTEETPKQTVFVITDKESTDSVEEPVEKMEENNITLFSIGIGPYLNPDKLKEISTKSEKNSVHLDSFADLASEKFQKSIFNQFCGSQIVYTSKETDMVCVIVCSSYVDEAGEGQDEEEVDNLRTEVEDVFHINCSKCREYTTAEALNISQTFASQLNRGEVTGIMYLLVQYIISSDDSDSDSNSQATTASSETEEEPKTALCGSDFKSDIWFMIDRSPTIADQDFEAVLNFSSTMASRFNVTRDGVQLGLSVYSRKHKVLYALNTTTDIDDFRETNSEAKKAPIERNVGKALESVLNVAFDVSHGARADDPEVQKNMVVIVTGNSTDSVEEAKKQLEEKNVTVFAVGVGDVNTTMLDTLASEPKAKHAVKLTSFKNLSASIAQNILKTVADTPIVTARNRSARLRLSPGSRKQITTKLSRSEDLVINVTSSDPTATLRVYVKVGKVYVNAANYDALITLEEGGGQVVIEASKLLERYPDLQGSEVDLSVAIVSNKRVRIEVAFAKDERTEEQKLIDSMEDLHYDCSNTSEKSVCVERFDDKFEQAKNLSVEAAKLQKFQELVKSLKQDIVVDELEDLSDNCENTTVAKASCVESLEAALQEAENLTVEDSILLKYYRLARRLKQELIVAEVESLTEECENATSANKSDCYAKLEEKLAEAEELNVTSIVEDSVAALREYQASVAEQNDKDAQSSPSDYAWVIALGVLASLLLSSCFIFALHKRKKRKDKIEPIEDDSARETATPDIGEQLEAWTQEAKRPDADYLCMIKLKEIIEDARDANIDEDRLFASREVLEHLEVRISQIQQALKSKATCASMPDSTAHDKEELEEQLKTAESLHFPIGELEEAQNALSKLNRQAHVLENIETFVADIHQGNTSPTLLHNLIDKLNESRILGIPDQKIAEARELANTLAPEMMTSQAADAMEHHSRTSKTTLKSQASGASNTFLRDEVEGGTAGDVAPGLLEDKTSKMSTATSRKSGIAGSRNVSASSKAGHISPADGPNELQAKLSALGSASSRPLSGRSKVSKTSRNTKTSAHSKISNLSKSPAGSHVSLRSAPKTPPHSPASITAVEGE